MPRRTFPYAAIPLPPTDPFPDGHIVYRPLAVARVYGHSGKTITCIVWPDSGADQCVFPVSFAIALGLNPLTMPQQITGGVGNSGNVTYYDHLRTEMGHMVTADELTTFQPICSFSAYAGFTLGLEAQGLGLLGQSGFFENYSVTFNHKRREFYIDQD